MPVCLLFEQSTTYLNIRDLFPRRAQHSNHASRRNSAERDDGDDVAITKRDSVAMDKETDRETDRETAEMIGLMKSNSRHASLKKPLPNVTKQRQTDGENETEQEGKSKRDKEKAKEKRLSNTAAMPVYTRRTFLRGF